MTPDDSLPVERSTAWRPLTCYPWATCWAGTSAPDSRPGASHRHNQFADAGQVDSRPGHRSPGGGGPGRGGGLGPGGGPDGGDRGRRREWRRDYDRAVKIPQELAVALAKATAAGETVLERTRPSSDWETFKPFWPRRSPEAGGGPGPGLRCRTGTTPSWTILSR